MRFRASLPSLTGLHVFECVGRLQSFRAAGEELCITQSAVSYHIQQLERRLDVRLFEREARGIRFTEHGRRFHEKVCRAFKDLEDATAELTGGSAHEWRLRVSVLPSFASCWLVRRLPALRRAHPGLDLTLQPELGVVDLERGESDLAIRYGRGHWAGVRSEMLIEERLCPVAAPAIAGTDGYWTQQRLLGAVALQASRPFEWPLWMKAAGFTEAPRQALNLSDYNIVLQAAVDGLGVAIGRRSLLQEHLHSGRLVPLHDRWLPVKGLGYWTCLPERPSSRATRLFVAWLRREALASAGR